MVKLFFAGLCGVVLLAIGAVSAAFSPMWAGVTQNLGGQPQSPFHVPQPIVDALYQVFGAATPQVMLYGSLSLSLLLLTYTFATIFAVTVKRYKDKQQMRAELAQRGRMSAAREAPKSASPTPTTSASRKAKKGAKAELESLWK